MKCSECNFYWQEEGEKFPSCKADPNFPAPCEEEDYEDEEVEDRYTLDDLGNNWW